MPSLLTFGFAAWIVAVVMRTLHLDTEKAWRGGQQQLLSLLEGLRARDVGAALLAQPDALLLEKARAAGIDARPFQAHGEADLLAAWRLARLIRAENFDILHCHTAHAHGIALVSRWLLSERERPKLVVARRVIFQPRGTGFFKPSRFKYRRADRIIAVSQAVKAGLLQQGIPADRVAVVRDGVDVARIVNSPQRTAEVRRSFALRDGERMIAHIAHLGEEKGQQDLIAAMRIIRATQSDARLVIVGEGKLRTRLEQQARSLGVTEAIVFAGFRPPDEIPTILKAAEVFVFPSVEEGLGSTLLEAMAAGVPVVATRAGGIPEIVEDERTGFLVPPRVPEALARAVLRLLQNSAEARWTADAAQRFAFSVGRKERMVDETIHVYQELLRH